ncbi:MAG: hypothetical protein KBB95_11330 [Deltaproteobacteria bacterium]|nr:hypothetical protein [Deltaproteobacteria bacterium]
MTARVGVGALLGLMLAACASTHATGVESPAAPELVAAPLPANEVDVSQVRALEAQCRQRFSAETFQQAANALTVAQVAVGQLCTIELVGNSPLQWRVSCGSDDFFESGAHTLASATGCEVGGVRGQNGFECLGLALRAMLPHAETVDIATIGHVDFTRPAARLDCADLVGEGWGTPPWTEHSSLRGDAARDAANDRLAWCRAARAASAIATGIGRRNNGVRLVAAGASTSWMAPRYRAPDEELETVGECPPPSAPDRDDPSVGRCASSRRVDVLVRMSARAEANDTGARCDRADQAHTPAGALYCLEQCLASPERSASGLGAATPFLEAGSPATPPARWHVSTSDSGLRVDLGIITRRLGY